jgi:hypothetical protein
MGPDLTWPDLTWPGTTTTLLLQSNLLLFLCKQLVNVFAVCLFTLIKHLLYFLRLLPIHKVLSVCILAVNFLRGFIGIYFGMNCKIEYAHFNENTLIHPNLSLKFCPVAYHLRSEMGVYVFIYFFCLTSLK